MNTDAFYKYINAEVDFTETGNWKRPMTREVIGKVI
jgi:hypothetical protein